MIASRVAPPAGASLFPCTLPRATGLSVTLPARQSDAEMAAVKKVQEIFKSKNLIPCTACRYCTDGCPKHIAIPDLFAVMNTKQLYHDWNADDYYSVVHTAPGRRASDCLK